MTQIMTCLTAGHIIQAVDTRLSYTDGRRDDKAIKMLAFRYGATFSYTGIARCGGHKTDEWLRRIMTSSGTFEEVLSRIQRDAPNLVRFAPPKYRHLAVVAASFIPSQDGPLYIPVLFVISNFHDIRCEQTAKAERSFGRLHHVFDVQKPVEFHWAGQDLSKKTNLTLARYLKQAIRRVSGRPTPHTLAKILVQGIRRTAEEEGSVGRNVLVTIVPNRSIPALAPTGTELLYFGSGRSLTPHLISRSGAIPVEEVSAEGMLALLNNLQA